MTAVCHARIRLSAAFAGISESTRIARLEPIVKIEETSRLREDVDELYVVVDHGHPPHPRYPLPSVGFAGTSVRGAVALPRAPDSTRSPTGGFLRGVTPSMNAICTSRKSDTSSRPSRGCSDDCGNHRLFALASQRQIDECAPELAAEAGIGSRAARVTMAAATVCPADRLTEGKPVTQQAVANAASSVLVTSKLTVSGYAREVGDA